MATCSIAHTQLAAQWATLTGVAIPVLTPEDGAALDRALNEVADLASKSLIHTDLFLHYRNDKGWRAWFGDSHDQEGAQAWVAEGGPWAGLLDALREQVEPVAVIDSRLFPAKPRRRRAS